LTHSKLNIKVPLSLGGKGMVVSLKVASEGDE